MPCGKELEGRKEVVKDPQDIKKEFSDRREGLVRWSDSLAWSSFVCSFPFSSLFSFSKGQIKENEARKREEMKRCKRKWERPGALKGKESDRPSRQNP